MIILPKIEEYYTKKLTSLIPTKIQIPFSIIIDYLDSINPIIILGIIILIFKMYINHLYYLICLVLCII